MNLLHKFLVCCQVIKMDGTYPDGQPKTVAINWYNPLAYVLMIAVTIVTFFIEGSKAVYELWKDTIERY